MIWLLDVSVLVAYLVPRHQHHVRTASWILDKQTATCPITELGFLRVACALDFSMNDARHALARFVRDDKPLFIPCDLRVLDGSVVLSPRKTTDSYLADLAALRSWRFATLDAGINHPAVDLLP